jgi:hypothetical protein
MQIFSKVVVVCSMAVASACTTVTDDGSEAATLTASELCDRAQSSELLRVQITESDPIAAGSLVAHAGSGMTEDSPFCWQPASFAAAIRCDSERRIDLMPSEVTEPSLRCHGRIDTSPFADGLDTDHYSRECAETTAVCEPIAGTAVGVLDGDRLIIDAWEPAP